MLSISLKRLINNRLLLCAVVIIFLLSGCAPSGPAPEAVATVNGDEITDLDLEGYLNLVYLYWPDFNAGEQIDAFKEQMLWFLIESRVLEQEINRLGIQTDEEAITKTAGQERAELIETYYLTEEAFTSRLKELKLEEKDLLTIPRHTHYQELLFNYLGDEISEEDARRFMEENPIYLEQYPSVYAFDILLGTMEEAQEVRQLLDEGADFLELGRERSLGSDIELGLVYNDGGDDGSVDPLFLETAFALNPGEISSPVEMGDGFHIIMITEKNAAKTLNFDDVRDEAVEMQKLMRYNEYVEQLMQDAQVEIF